MGPSTGNEQHGTLSTAADRNTAVVCVCTDEAMAGRTPQGQKGHAAGQTRTSHSAFPIPESKRRGPIAVSRLSPKERLLVYSSSVLILDFCDYKCITDMTLQARGNAGKLVTSDSRSRHGLPRARQRTVLRRGLPAQRPTHAWTRDSPSAGMISSCQRLHLGGAKNGEAAAQEAFPVDAVSQAARVHASLHVLHYRLENKSSKGSPCLFV